MTPLSNALDEFLPRWLADVVLISLYAFQLLCISYFLGTDFADGARMYLDIKLP